MCVGYLFINNEYIQRITHTIHIRIEKKNARVNDHKCATKLALMHCIALLYTNNFKTIYVFKTHE